MLATAAMLAAACSFGVRAQAPRPLFNKTVAFSYNADSVVRDPDGKTHAVHAVISYTWYISTAGRIFERSARTPGRGPKQAGKFAPDAALRTKTGEARNVHFEGSKIVSLRGFVKGASRTVVSFDPGFSSCTVSVQQGKEGGAFKRKGTDGAVRDYLSIKVSGQTCSVREGNPFAS